MKVLFLLIFLYLFDFGVVYLFEALVGRIFLCMVTSYIVKQLTVFMSLL
jgi:hypothetical protein